MNTSLPLNVGQQAAADGFFSFLFDKEPSMIISGPGGTGKTFTMGHLIEDGMPRYFEMCQIMGIEPEYDQVVMTATTNQAANVLSVATKRPTQTIHSFLSLKVENDYNTGRTLLKRNKNWKVHQKQIIFVDECSTIDPILLQMIQEGTFLCKVVYVGDHCQLGPVGYTSSPIYKLGLPFYELTEPMRNAGQPALIALCQQLRTTVETGEFKDILVVPGVVDWITDDLHLEGLIQQNFLAQTQTNRLLAYTNDRVNQANDTIRTMRGLPDDFGVNEFVVNNSALKMGGKFMISVDEEVRIVNQGQPEAYRVDQYDGKDINVIVRRSLLNNNFGMLYHDVPVPVDRNHVASLLQHYKRIKNWEKFYYIKETLPDLRPRDAATIHKAQGSSYDTVFLDVGNLSSCHNPSLVSRLLYVAVSRARKRVIMYGDLAPKYGRIINS